MFLCFLLRDLCLLLLLRPCEGVRGHRAPPALLLGAHPGTSTPRGWVSPVGPCGSPVVHLVYLWFTCVSPIRSPVSPLYCSCVSPLYCSGVSPLSLCVSPLSLCVSHLSLCVSHLSLFVSHLYCSCVFHLCVSPVLLCLTCPSVCLICTVPLCLNCTVPVRLTCPCVPVSLQTVVVGSYLIAHGFFSVYAMCVDTLFLCFCEWLPSLLREPSVPRPLGGACR